MQNQNLSVGLHDNDNPSLKLTYRLKSRWVFRCWMLAHRLRRWPNIKPAPVQCIVFAGLPSQQTQDVEPMFFLMLVPRLRRWSNIKTTSAQCIVFTGFPLAFLSAINDGTGRMLKVTMWRSAQPYKTRAELPIHRALPVTAETGLVASDSIFLGGCGILLLAD